MNFLQLNSHLSSHSLIPSSPFPHTHNWWCTYWSESCALMRMVDAQDLIYDVCLFNIISIFSLIRIIINTCTKGSHSPCSWITSFHGFGVNIEVVLYQICMRTFLWVWWCGGSHILCKTLYFHSHILFNSKSKKLQCEKLAFSCHCITSFRGFCLQSWRSFIPDWYEGSSMSWMILGKTYMMYYSVI